MANLEYEEDTSQNTGNFLKPKGGLGLVDVVKDFSWTLSPPESRIEVPYVYLNEYQQTGGQLIASIIYYARIANQGFSSITSPDQAEVYNYKYIAEPTGWRYKFPFLSKHHTNRSNSFGGNGENNPFSQLASMGQSLIGYNAQTGSIGSALKYITGFGAALNSAKGIVDTMVPGKVSFESPKSWDNTPEETITIQFHLFNTKSVEDVRNNRNLAHILRYNNSPNRDNFAIMAPPVIYSLKIPDICYMPACHISALEISDLGNTRYMDIGQGIQRIVPEAYSFNMTFTSLLTPSRNILRALDKGEKVKAINNVVGLNQFVADFLKQEFKEMTTEGPPSESDIRERERLARERERLLGILN
jgi:hypothetical protein